MRHYIPSDYGTTFGCADTDYMTLTTFSRGAFNIVRKMIGQVEGVPDRVPRYSGKRYGQIRLLEGQQMGKEHFMVIAEGSSSRWLVETMRDVVSEDGVRPLGRWFKCTRIDMQIASPDKDLDFRELKDDVGDPKAKWRRRGGKPKVSLIEGQKSSRGLGSTLYVGSSKTKNGHFVRIYEKLGPNDKRHIRFEVQFKGKKADQVFFDLMKRDVLNPAPYIRGVLATFPLSVVHKHFHLQQNGLASIEGVTLSAEKVTSDDVKKALWFKYHVAPSLSKITSRDSAVLAINELIRTIYCIRHNMMIRERMEVASMLHDADEAERAMRQEAAITQSLATVAAIEEDRKKGSDNRHGDIVQESLFDAEELDALLSTIFSGLEEWRA